MNEALSRRTVLRGVGVTMALPWLESIGGFGARVLGATPPAPAAAAPAATAAPVRMVCVFTPNGVNYPMWAPTGEGAAYTLSPTLESLAPVRQYLNVVTGLTLNKARANGDGPGDHARSSASFLTGHQARKTAGNDIRIGMSVDQFAARQIGRETRLPSLEIGCENGPAAGNCDSGYSCAYTSNISWRDESTPMSKIVDPAEVFEALFGNAAQAAEKAERLSRRQSILDFVQGDAKRLDTRLGVSDRRKLDQFQTAVREIEQRVQRARAESTDVKRPDVEPPPPGIPRSVQDHVDLMYDMLTLALQTDVTRVSTFMLGVDGSNRTFPDIGVKEGHHQLSHHQENAEMIEKIRKIDKFYVERFARFLDKLSKVLEGEGTLLDHCMVMYGGGISDGNKHNHEDLPILLAGRAAGSIDTGRLIRTPRETPLCNLYISMLERMGCEVQSFGDSTGALSALTA